MPPRVALIDANVFFAPRMRDLVMHLHAEELINVHWTREIESEWTRNVVVKQEADAEGIQACLTGMRDAVPGWEVTGYSKHVGKFEAVDAKDRHVAAAAYKLSLDDWPGQAVALVTKNVKDFPAKAFAGTEVTESEPERAGRELPSPHTEVASGTLRGHTSRTTGFLGVFPLMHWWRNTHAYDATTLVELVVHEVSGRQGPEPESCCIVLCDELHEHFGQPVTQLASAPAQVHGLHDTDSPASVVQRRGNTLFVARSHSAARHSPKPARERLVREAHVRATREMPQQAAGFYAHRVSGGRIDSHLGQLLQECPSLQYGPSSFVWSGHCGRASPFNAVPACTGFGQ